MVYTPITRGHKPTASQESNTLSTMSEVSCTTTLSASTDNDSRDDDRLSDFREETEEHTSELQSHSDLVCRLLLEKKKNNKQKKKTKEEKKQKKHKQQKKK